MTTRLTSAFMRATMASRGEAIVVVVAYWRTALFQAVLPCCSYKLLQPPSWPSPPFRVTRKVDSMMWHGRHFFNPSMWTLIWHWHYCKQWFRPFPQANQKLQYRALHHIHSVFQSSPNAKISSNWVINLNPSLSGGVPCSQHLESGVVTTIPCQLTGRSHY